MKESLDFNGAGRHFLETVSYEHSNFSQACDAVILTHTHLEDRPRCIRDIPKTSSSSWSQDEEMQLRKLGVKTPRHVLLYNATTVASKIWCLQFLAQSPGLPLGTRRHGLRIHRMHVDILGSLALAWMHQTMGGTEVKTGSNGQTELSILTVLLGYYICWKYIHNQKLLTIVVCVCGFIVWIEICRIMLKDRHK